MKTENSSLAVMEWYLTAGVDEIVGETPVNRLTAKFDILNIPLYQKVPRAIAASLSVPAPAPVPVSAATAELAAKAATLDELRAAMENFDGCALKQTAANLVFADGNPAADLMIVGEAPGAEEDKKGLPFVGASGHLLDLMLKSIGRDRTNVYISNVVSWRPPNNRKPSEDEIALLTPFIKRHIALVHPKVLLLLGGSAVSALIGIKDGITRTRGRWLTYRDGDVSIPAFASFHPAFLLRSPAQKKAAWRDFLTVKEKTDITRT
ncbi:MAG TPA: uracil-DNA glycosylase [Alphaproteobacteria bacterium]|nr:uracil-DNA glycosylase [Alphaproteobacteria bacterium]